jgi:hypothetical protein
MAVCSGVRDFASLLKSLFTLTLSDPMSDIVRHDFSVPDAFPHVVRTLANRERRLYSFCLYFSLLKL